MSDRRIMTGAHITSSQSESFFNRFTHVYASVEAAGYDVNLSYMRVDGKPRCRCR